MSYVNKKSAFCSHKNVFYNIIQKRHLDSVLEISKHFVERFMQRNEDTEFHLNVYKALHSLANNICLYIYEFELGLKPTHSYKDIKIEMIYNGEKIFLTTVYRKEE